MYGNIKARNINDFIASALENCGYYIGRYEAGDSVATESNTDRTGTNGQSTEGTLVVKANQKVYNWVRQGKAASKCKEMYEDGYYKGTFSSDLINSYAWDTAVIFIQTFGTDASQYSTTVHNNSDTTFNLNLAHTGGQGDEKCNINDMAGNALEWTTETCDWSPQPIRRGNYPKKRGRIYSGQLSSKETGFRPILYLG